ncbi:protein canopy homolog 4-like [Panonychus citri]|uniref:protein canopy homolog 4-like n=1 Tax=Panonychus citri TaxID=50023 RepID=UPI002307C731|nr:protein canopy homolog 4-like [Panonychus citri]
MRSIVGNLLSVYLVGLLILDFFGFVCLEGELEEEHGVKYASQCEACKYFVLELEERLKETGKSHDVIEVGYSLDSKQKKRKKYQQSELRLVESLDGICERLLEYNIHKERKDSTRFAKGMSQTFQTLHGLVDKGVKVDLGIPFELWDKPSAEVTNLKTQCELLLERHEDDVENWYWNHQDESLQKFLCIDRALRKGDSSCIFEGKETESPKQERLSDSPKQEL